MFPHRILLLAAASLLTGCAGPVALSENPNSPTNPAALESAPPPLSTTFDHSTAVTELSPSQPNAGRPDPTTRMGDMKGMNMPGMNAGKESGASPSMHGNTEGMPGMTSDHPAASQPATTQIAMDYTCSMHPQIHQDHPGNCPICGMKLVKKDAGKNAQKGGDQ